MINSKSNAIVELLMQDRTSREIINMGYKPGTVFTVQRRWRQGKSGIGDATGSVISASNNTLHAGYSSSKQSDNDAVQLEQEYRERGLGVCLTN